MERLISPQNEANKNTWKENQSIPKQNHSWLPQVALMQPLIALES